MDNLEVMAPADDPEVAENDADEVYEDDASNEPDHSEGAEDHSEDDIGDDDGEDDGGSDPELVEVEFEGKTHKVSPELKDALMRQADYTRKTQDVAEQRKQFEAERETYQQRAQAEKEIGEDVFNLRMMDNELSQLREVDWNLLSQNDPNLFNQLLPRYTMLKDQRDDLQNKVSQKHYELQASAEREAAIRRESVAREIAATIPDYTEEKGRTLKSFATEMGFQEHDLERSWNNDPKIAKVLNLAYLGHQVATKRTSPKKKAASEAKPAPVTQLRGKGKPSSGPSDRQHIDTWMRERRKQLNSG